MTLSTQSNSSGLTDLELLHLYFLTSAQGTTETVELKTDCPRCQGLLSKLEKVA